MTPILSRRRALILLTGVIAAMTEKTRAQEKNPLVWAGQGITLSQITPTLAFDLAAFKEYQFSHKGETIIITPDEMWAALKGDPK